MTVDLKQERELVVKARKDTEVFGQLYDQNFGRIFGYVLRRTASVPVAQDVTSEVFFKALKNLEKFHWQGIPFSAWLYRIASHEIANYYRKKRREAAHAILVRDGDPAVNPLSVEIAQAEDILMRHEEYLSLHMAIAQLPPRYQEVITLRYFEDKQIKEIAQIIGKREGTVKSLLHRGLERMRNLMG
ncbi:MAG: RNA polymerase sigma factor [Dehalococcoidales bacterium]|nr:MAG: RNA polymerase sigma factor [Dehalococcoidales bacterium]